MASSFERQAVDTSEDYAAAIKVHDEAWRVYKAARNAFFAKKITEAEFMEAKRVRNIADAEFERAYTAKWGRVPVGSHCRID